MFRITLSIIFTLSLLFITGSSIAADKKLLRYRYGYVNFIGKGDRIYLLKNISRRPVLLDRYHRYNRTADAGWSSFLLPGKWSALIISLPMFTMSCEIKSPHDRYRRVCCKNVIKIWPITNFTNNNKDFGDFWIAENLSCKAFQKRIKARGFIFKFPEGGC